MGKVKDIFWPGVLILILVVTFNYVEVQSPVEKKLQILNRRYQALDFSGETIFGESPFSNRISGALKVWQVLINAKEGSKNLSSSQLEDEKGILQDLTGDGQAELIYSNRSNGVSGYLQEYRVFKKEGLKFLPVWQAEVYEGAVEFQEKTIIVVEPIWQDAECHACIDKYSQKTYRWDGREFKLSEEKEINTLSPGIIRFTI